MWSYGIQEMTNLKTIQDQELKNKTKMLQKTRGDFLQVCKV